MKRIRPDYSSSRTLSITLASLASDMNLLAGWSSAAYDNRVMRDLDVWIAGQITTGTSPTTDRSIEVWIVPFIPGLWSSGWPDAFDGTDKAVTVASRQALSSYARPAHTITITSTSNAVYAIAPVSVAQVFGGVMPPQFALWVVQNTGVALHATGTNHVLVAIPIRQVVE